MSQKIIPSIAERDYEDIRRICSNMPSSFEEWQNQQGMSKTHYKKLGYKVLEVLIDPQELRNYCKAMRFSPALAILSHFAMARFIQNSR